MNLLTKPSFIEAIRHLSQGEKPCHTLIYTEINHALQVASLLGGTTAEQQLMAAIQMLIFSKVQQLDCCLPPIT